MGTQRYSGYLADDESFKGPQMRNPNTSHGKGHDYWRHLMRPPSRCGFRNRDAPHSHFSAASTFAHAHKEKQKRHGSTCGESNLADDEFSDFMNFLADEDVLDSLQDIVEDAVRKLRDVTTEDGQHLFDIVEESCSSPESASWSVSYSHRHTDSSSTYSHSKYYTTTATATTTSITATSSSDEDRERKFRSKGKQKPAGKVCLLDKFVSKLAKPEKEKKMSGGFHAETVSERFGDNYYFLQEHFHIWAKLAESFNQLPPKDYFSKFKKLPKQELSAESLHKEITNVLKQRTPSTFPLYSMGQEPFLALDFLEENGILAALQDIINQAVQKVLDTTLGDGAPLFNIFGDESRLSVPWESSMGGSDEEEEEEGEDEGEGDEDEGSGSGEKTSEGDSISDDESTPGRKKKRRKGKRKKKVPESAAEDGKGKPKYTPPPLPKPKRKSIVSEEPQRKPKYVPPPLPKTKPRLPPEEPQPKPKYTPPPLPKPKKKQEAVQTEAQPKKVLARHIITTQDIKRAHLQARPLPKQAIMDFLIENAAKLIIYKYNYETLLSEKLGFISVPITKVLLEIMFGYKRIKGSSIRLTSQIDWTKVNEEIYAPRPPKPKTPKFKAGDKKKARDKKEKKPADKKKPRDVKKSVAFKPEMPTGKVVVTMTPVEKKEVKVSKMKGRPFSAEQEGSKQREITEILPLQFPQEFTIKEGSEATEAVQPPDEEPSKRSFPIIDDSPMRSVVSQKSFISKDSSVKLPSVPLESEGPQLTPKQSALSQRLHGETYDSKRGSITSVFQGVEPTSQPSIESLKKSSSYRKASINGETCRKSSTILPKI